jgi:hypothetical protein
MVEAYSTQQLAITDGDWKTCAACLKAIDVFSNEAIPGPYVYENWQDWAAALVNAINVNPYVPVK